MKRMKQTGIYALCLLLMACGSKDGRQEAAPVKVKVLPVTAATTGSVRNFSGTIEPENETAMSFPISGTIEHIAVEVGQLVGKGQLLARVDATSMQSSYDAARAALEQAQDAYARMKQLHERGSLPEIQWVEVESKLQQAESMERIARKNLEDCRLTAPFAGVVSAKSMEVGQNTVPGTTVVKLATIDPVKVRISVPEGEIAGIVLGRDATVGVPALGDGSFTGRIVEKGVTANPLSHAYEVKLRVGNPAHDLLPGMVTRVSLTDTLAASFMLPAQCVLLGEDNTMFVWVNANGTAARRPVVCGRPASGGVTVVSGLREGDEVLVEGQQKVSQGMRLEIIR